MCVTAPDFNWIRQADTTANWDHDAHAAAPDPHPELVGAWSASLEDSGPPQAGVQKLPRRNHANILATVAGEVLQVAGYEEFIHRRCSNFQEWLIVRVGKPNRQRLGSSQFSTDANLHNEHRDLFFGKRECWTPQYFVVLGKNSGVVAET